ncbi:MAG: hypothetical protein NC347_13840 [Clostridium sp.]|nr:hypothetical protein [Clostridium sp.]
MMMEEKGMSKGTKIVIGVLIALVLLLVVLVGILLLGKEKEKQGGTGNAGPFVVEEGMETDTDGNDADIFDRELEKESAEAGDGITMVIDGFQFYVPADYGCFYAEGVGPVVYLDDVFQMKTAVRDHSYEETMKDPEALMSKTVEAGGKILQDIKETELDGKKYAYFLMELSGDKCFVGYTQAADTDKRFGGQIVIESDSLTDEDLLHIFADITSTAQVTDKPDSTMDDIVEQSVHQGAAAIGEKKEESTLSIADATVTFQVPEGFYSQGAYHAEGSESESFWSDGYGVSVDCCLAADDEFVGSALVYVENERDMGYDSVKDNMQIQTIEIAGNTCYYMVVHYNFEGTDYQRLCAACDVGDGNAYYSVQACAIDWEDELSMETVKDFLVFK